MTEQQAAEEFCQEIRERYGAQGFHAHLVQPADKNPMSRDIHIALTQGGLWARGPSAKMLAIIMATRVSKWFDALHKEGLCPRDDAEHQKWRAACHEAGHALVAVYQGRAFVAKIRDDGDGNWGGNLDYAINNPLEQPGLNWSDDELAKWQQCYAAGCASEQMMCGDCPADRCQTDRERHGALGGMRRSRRPNGWEEDVQSVRRFLDRRHVEMVANEFIHSKEGQLDHEDVRKLLGMACCKKCSDLIRPSSWRRTP